MPPLFGQPAAPPRTTLHSAALHSCALPLPLPLDSPPAPHLLPACCSVVVLNDIHIDIMDYIVPASCADVQFRSMWAEFEWENKVRLPPAGGRQLLHLLQRRGATVGTG